MTGYSCNVCGAHHDEMPLGFGVRMPLYAEQVPEAEWEKRVVLASELCIVDGEHFFILGNLALPIVGRHETVCWSVWSSLSKTSFERVTDLWETPGREGEPPYFGWLSNSLPGYDKDTLNVKLAVRTQPVGLRPCLDVAPQDHPLYREQTQGISWERACDLSHAAFPSIAR